MARRFSAQHPDGPLRRDEHRVLVGWTHNSLNNGFVLNLERTKSMVALENDQIETEHLLLTRNQALILGRYLMTIAGERPPRLSRAMRLRLAVRRLLKRR